VLKLGGNLVQLHSTRLDGEDTLEMDFFPRECRVGPLAVADARKYFSEIVESILMQQGEGAVADSDSDFLIVRGQVVVEGTFAWRAQGDAQGMAALLCRDYSERDSTWGECDSVGDAAVTGESGSRGGCKHPRLGEYPSLVWESAKIIKREEH